MMRILCCYENFKLQLRGLEKTRLSLKSLRLFGLGESALRHLSLTLVRTLTPYSTSIHAPEPNPNSNSKLCCSAGSIKCPMPMGSSRKVLSRVGMGAYGTIYAVHPPTSVFKRFWSAITGVISAWCSFLLPVCSS